MTMININNCNPEQPNRISERKWVEQNLNNKGNTWQEIIRSISNTDTLECGSLRDLIGNYIDAEKKLEIALQQRGYSFPKDNIKTE